MRPKWMKGTMWEGLGTSAMIALAVLVTPGSVAAQEPASDEVAAEAARPAADPSDVESIDSIILAVYDVISGEKGEARDWDRFRSLFLPEARLIPSGRRPDGSHGYIVWSPEEYISTAGQSLVNNGFFEDEAHRVVEQWADIAHVFSTYNSYATEADMEAGNHFQRGINSFQLMHDGQRWWVVSIMWEAEAPNRPIDEKYLGGEM